MSIEEYVPTDAEVPADHWSKSAEWQEFKRKQSELEASIPRSKGNTLPAHMQVGTINTEKRKMTTHEIQMESCKVEWVDPNPPAELDAEVEAAKLSVADLLKKITEGKSVPTEAEIESLAKDILANVTKACNTAEVEFAKEAKELDAKAG